MPCTRIPWIEAAIGYGSDVDHFEIKTLAESWDYIRIDFDNQTSALKPQLGIYGADKKWIGGTSDQHFQVIAGQNASYSFKAAPDATCFIYIRDLHGRQGDYRLRVSPAKAFDRFEPNDDLIKVKHIMQVNAGYGNYRLTVAAQ